MLLCLLNSVMLVMMQLHRLCIDLRLQRVV